MKAEKLDVDRDWYNVPWTEEPGADQITGETATLKFHNAADGSKSSTVVVNGSGGPVSVEKGWSGVDKVTVTGSLGGELVIEEVTFG